MELKQRRIASVKSHFLSPFRHIYKPRVDDITKKPISINLLTSYLRYKQHPLSGNFKEDLKNFIKTNHGKDNISSRLIKNFMENSKTFNIQTYQKFKKNYRKINKQNNSKKNNFQSINILNKHKYNSITLSDSQKYKKRYEFLMKNLSYNGNNSNSSFKNISNNNLDNIFKNTPFISFDETHIKLVNKIPKKYNIFFSSINSEKMNDEAEKKITNLSQISKNMKSDRKKLFNNYKKNSNNLVEFENKILNKINDRKIFKDNCFDYNYKFKFNIPKYLLMKLQQIKL